MSAPTRDQRMLAALTTRIHALKVEYADNAAEIEEVATYLDALVARAWSLHDRIVNMRCVAFKVLARTQSPDCTREAA